MATIKAIEGRSVHQIQSGQVIVDICSVVKELVENSLDAHATSVEIRFKNNGLDSIEVQDNGDGISSENFETVALKHFTSKLTTYSDLASLHTFGFRGEALSSLCALSDLHIITARLEDGAKGNKLAFDSLGKLRDKSIVASQKGTTVVVERLFKNLPVRRRELEKNIKREYGKVLGVLNAYACISIGVKFIVSNVPSKGKKIVVFSTKSNPTTSENISNVFGVKTLHALVPLDLKFDMESSNGPGQKSSAEAADSAREVYIIGHISRPTFGEGRQTPDRQMFFVNGRPCGLPQIAKAFNEVYKSYNMSQAPFIFANLILDTNSYDVNVSPDKRTILLHDQVALLDSLKASLIELFDAHDQIVPQSQLHAPKIPAFKQLSITKEMALNSKSTNTSLSSQNDGEDELGDFEEEDTASVVRESAPTRWQRPSSVDKVGQKERSVSLIRSPLDHKADDQVQPPHKGARRDGLLTEKQSVNYNSGKEGEVDQVNVAAKEPSKDLTEGSENLDPNGHPVVRQVLDFNARIASQMARRAKSLEHSSSTEHEEEEAIQSVSPNKPRPSQGPVKNAFDRMRPRRTPAEPAIITIGSKVITSPIGMGSVGQSSGSQDSDGPRLIFKTSAVNRSRLRKATLRKGLQGFAAPGTQVEDLDSAEGRDDSQDWLSKGADRLKSAHSSDAVDRIEEADDSREVLGEPEIMQNSSAEESQCEGSGNQSDDEYIDENEKKAREDAKVAKLIQDAESGSGLPPRNNVQRVDAILKGGSRHKDCTSHLLQKINVSLSKIQAQTRTLRATLNSCQKLLADNTHTSLPVDGVSVEDRLSLSISKDDFAKMRIIGQFNLGFILTMRSSASDSQLVGGKDELFIIDQHASDEKYNFELLQASTVVQNQRLVRPRTLDLTAIEEEIVIDNLDTLERNGFLVTVDTTGEAPVGRRCTLISLPMSKQVVFDTRDLEELIALIADAPDSSAVVRPSKVRKMFAMRACRSSIMVGRTLTKKQMGKVVVHLGGLDKPWNCPHGRPTMRHLTGLADWELWRDGDGLAGMEEGGRSTDWAGYIAS